MLQQEIDSVQRKKEKKTKVLYIILICVQLSLIFCIDVYYNVNLHMIQVQVFLCAAYTGNEFECEL